MKTLTGKELCRLVEKHDWKLDRINGSHHIYYKEGVKGNLSIPVHGNQDLKKGIQLGLMKTANLTKEDLL